MNKMISSQDLSKTRKNLEGMLDQRLTEVKCTIMQMVDQSLDEKILNGREAVLIALEKAPTDIRR